MHKKMNALELKVEQRSIYLVQPLSSSNSSRLPSQLLPFSGGTRGGERKAAMLLFKGMVKDKKRQMRQNFDEVNP